jgi:hypothetical protein
MLLKGNINKVGLSNNKLKKLLLKGGSLKKFKALVEFISAATDPATIKINKVYIKTS